MMAVRKIAIIIRPQQGLLLHHVARVPRELYRWVDVERAGRH